MYEDPAKGPQSDVISCVFRSQDMWDGENEQMEHRAPLQRSPCRGPAVPQQRAPTRQWCRLQSRTAADPGLPARGLPAPAALLPLTCARQSAWHTPGITDDISSAHDLIVSTLLYRPAPGIRWPPVWSRAIEGVKGHVLPWKTVMQGSHVQPDVLQLDFSFFGQVT